ncbi:MAG TPA: hypothetical protein PLO89_00235 [Spirochaetota bacterium]|nr:hypothetical protein [Spirochaetota bacterium]
MAKRKLQTSLLFFDAVTLLLIAVLIFILFEVIIKPGMIEQNLEKFYENMSITDFDYKNSVKFLEEKKVLSYKENIFEVYDYLIKSTKNRLKYDHSVAAISFPKDTNLFFAEEKKKSDRSFEPRDFDYDYFNEKIKNNEKYVLFNLKGKAYIGIAAKSDAGTYKNLDRTGDLVYPIFIIADRKDEFDFTTDVKKIVFIIWLSLIVIIVGGVKFMKTGTVSKEINNIGTLLDNLNSDNCKDIKPNKDFSCSTKEISQLYEKIKKYSQDGFKL